MNVNRRDFVLLAAAACAGCRAGGGGPSGRSSAPREVNAGPTSLYAADGVYDRFRDEGFYLVRAGGELAAISSVCTHRDCTVRAKPDHSFACKCHGSTFDPAGHVTKGPATRDLPRFATSLNAAGHVVVHLTSDVG